MAHGTTYVANYRKVGSEVRHLAQGPCLATPKDGRGIVTGGQTRRKVKGSGKHFLKEGGWLLNTSAGALGGRFVGSETKFSEPSSDPRSELYHGRGMHRRRLAVWWHEQCLLVGHTWTVLSNNKIYETPCCEGSCCGRVVLICWTLLTRRSKMQVLLRMKRTITAIICVLGALSCS